MRVGIIDADLIARKKHRFPNLACMKLSAYHKKQGCLVELLLSYDNLADYDKVFISKVFTDTPVPEGVTELPNVQYGGTGFFYDAAPPLPEEIEHTMPDYHLYDRFVDGLRKRGVRPGELQYYTDYSLGFTTRGCIRGCSFCVNRNYRSCRVHSPVEEFLDPDKKYICLLDDNVLACSCWFEIFQKLQATGKRFQFKQGLDERLLTDEKCDVIFGAPWIGDVIFAFDNIADRDLIEQKLRMIRRHTDRIPKFYVFCGYNHRSPDSYPEDFWAADIRDLFERIRILMSYRALPYVMRYKDCQTAPPPYRGMYITIARWCNQPSFVKKKSFYEFCLLNGAGSAAMRYAEEYKRRHPEDAERYFHMRWENMGKE